MVKIIVDEVASEEAPGLPAFFHVGGVGDCRCHEGPEADVVGDAGQFEYYTHATQ